MMNISPYGANQASMNNLRTGTLITPEIAKNLSSQLL
jgi:hypothetical protein